MKNSILIAGLLGLSAAGFSATGDDLCKKLEKKAKSDQAAKLKEASKSGRASKSEEAAKSEKAPVFVCVDLKNPVTPLAVELSPNTALTIKILDKSPWQKVTFDVKRSDIEDPTGKQYEALFKKLLPLVAGISINNTDATVTAAKKLTAEEMAEAAKAAKAAKAKDDCTKVEPISAHAVADNVKEPFKAAFTGLYKAQAEVSADQGRRNKCVAASAEIVTALHKAVDKNVEDIAASTTDPAYNEAIQKANESFKADLRAISELPKSKPKDNALDVAKDVKADPNAISEPPESAPEDNALDVAKARWARITFTASSQIYLALEPLDQARVDEELARALGYQNKIEKEAASLSEKESTLSTTRKLLEEIEKETDKKWFELTQPYQAPENRKASISITWLDRGSPAATKSDPIAFDATWKKVSPVSMSLGFAFSSLAKTDFGLATVRDASLSLTNTTTSAVSYKLSSTPVRPVAFPLALFHYDLPHSLPQSRWGFALSGGAGVDVSGSSPTGEFAFGPSVRFRSLYFSGLLHLGRRKELQDEFKVDEPAPAGFTVPTKGVWGEGFAFALTYRLPL